MMAEQQSKKQLESELTRQQFEEKLQAVKSNYDRMLKEQKKVWSDFWAD